MVLQGAQQWFKAGYIAETEAGGTGGPGEGVGKGKIVYTDKWITAPFSSFPFQGQRAFLQSKSSLRVKDSL